MFMMIFYISRVTDLTYAKSAPVNNPCPLKHIDTEKEKQHFENKLNNRTIIKQIS